MDSARALIARGWGVSLVSRCLRVSRAQLHVILRRTDDWMDGRRSRHTDDTDVLLRIHHVIGELPTYGYRRVWALLRRQAELDGMPAINAKRVYRIMRQNALLLERKPAVLNRPGNPETKLPEKEVNRMTKNTRFSPEVRQRAIRMVLESQDEYDSQWAAICSIAPKIGCTPETLRVWVRQHERDTGSGDGGLTTAERQRLKELERENRELRRSNDILRQASAYFAKAEFDRLWKK